MFYEVRDIPYLVSETPNVDGSVPIAEVLLEASIHMHRIFMLCRHVFGLVERDIYRREKPPVSFARKEFLGTVRPGRSPLRASEDVYTHAEETCQEAVMDPVSAAVMNAPPPE